MQDWYCKNLGDAMFAQEHLDALEDRYASFYGKAGAHRDRAVFFRHESEGRLHCEVHVYFPPAAADLALAVGAERCGAPLPAGLTLLAGSESSWASLFPGPGA